MRVGYVVKRFPRYSETFVVTEILAHEAAGWEIEIFSLRPTNDTHFQDLLPRVRAAVRYLPSEGAKAIDFWEALQGAGHLMPRAWGPLLEARGEQALDVYQALQLAVEVRQRGLEHLHAHFATTATSVARLAARIAGVPFTFTAHAKDIFHESVRPDDLRRKLEEAAATVTVSDFNLDYLHETYGPAAHRVRRLYNGLDLERFPYSDPRERPPRVMAVGRMVEKKGFAVLVDAAALLAERGVEFGVDLIGEGDLEQALRDRVRDLGLGSRVRLLGPRPQAELAEAVAAAAAIALPCIVSGDGDRDGLPTVLLEAMALGTPCVGTDVTGIPEVLRDGQTGLLVPQNDPVALADALERLLADASLRAALARRARDRIERDFDTRVNSARLRALISEAHGLTGARVWANGASVQPAGSGSDPMRIAYVCADDGVPVFGHKGCSIHVQEVLGALRGTGADLCLFASRLGGAPPPRLAGIPIQRLPRPYSEERSTREWEAVHANHALREALVAGGPFDAVYERYALWSFAGMEYARDTGAAGLLEVNAPLIDEQAAHRGLVHREVAELVTDRVFTAASRLIAVSQPLGMSLPGEARGRVRVIPNAIDPDRFPADVRPTRRMAGTFTVGFLGGLRPWHGLSLLAEAFARLVARVPNSRLLVVGDGPERRAFESALASFWVRDLADLTGAVAPDEVPGLLASMDAAVAPYDPHPSFYFSPLKIYEYMAAGLPVVASRVGQIPETIRHGETGLLCPAGDAAAIAEALERLAHDPGLGARLGANARRHVLADHTWGAVAGRILALADESLRERRDGTSSPVGAAMGGI